MAGFGKFKLTDALPKHVADSLPEGGGTSGPPGMTQGQGPARKRSKKAPVGATGTPPELAAEQEREARESSRARNATASPRGKMVDIGRGNQQAGRQKAK